jgi:hypothetical protein
MLTESTGISSDLSLDIAYLFQIFCQFALQWMHGAFPVGHEGNNKCHLN